MVASVESFTTDQVIRITGVSRRRLAYWLDRGIVSADIDEARGRGRTRLWSFRNLLEVRVALWLRDRLSLQLIGRIVKELRKAGLTSPLATVRFAVIAGGGRRGDNVVIQTGSGDWAHPITGQIIFEGTLPLQRFGEELTAAADRDYKRRRRAGVIERRRGKLGSKPVFAGTRIPVETVVRLHSAGWDLERILDNYPGLTAADVKAALAEAG